MTETTEISPETKAFEQLQILLESIEHHPDAAVRDHVRALAYTLLDLHHGALERIVQIISDQPDGAKTLQEFGDDRLVSAVLMVHELMPQTLETRVGIAVETAREQLQIYGADVEIVSIKNGVARLKLIGSSSTTNISTTLLKSEIEQAVHNIAPDLLDIEYEDLIASARAVKLVQIQPRQPVQDASPKKFFMPIIRADQVPDNRLRVVEVGGINLLLCNVAGTIYAFQNHCAEGNLPLERSIFADGVLTCPCHSYQFDVRQKGRCLNEADLRLESLPMRVENEIVKVALPKEDEINAGTTD